MAEENGSTQEAVVDDGLVGVAIDGVNVRVPKGTLVLDAALAAGVHIPVYCAHPKMDPVAVCRMCLVGVEKMPKLQPACATVVADGMVVTTQNAGVHKAREGVLEFLLENHPLDCPVCDRGGECDLQDFAFRYGPNDSRFSTADKVHAKKAYSLSDKIELDQERCILCWRCVRYYDEITGEKEIVLQERGIKTVIETYNGKQLTSEFQGNLPEVCPVGALTHKQYRFTTRPWDLQRTPSICPGCSYGCNIFADSRDFEVRRFASRDNPAVDDMWLCDRGRYSATSWNGRERVHRPATHRRGEKETFTTIEESYVEAGKQLVGVREKHGGSAIAVVASPHLTNEEFWLIQHLARHVLDTQHLNHSIREFPQLSPAEHALGIAEIEQCGTVIVVGNRAEGESPVLTLRLRKAQTKCGVQVLRVREDGSDVHDVVLSVHAEGSVGVVAHEDEREIAASLREELARKGKTVKQLTITRAVNGRGAKDLGIEPNLLPGYVPAKKSGKYLGQVLDLAANRAIKAMFIVHGSDLVEEIGEARLKEALSSCEVVVALEEVPSVVTELATVVIPGHSFFEKAGTVTNTEGRIQTLRPALPPATRTPNELAVLTELAKVCGDEPNWTPTASSVYERIVHDVPAYGVSRKGERASW